MYSGNHWQTWVLFDGKFSVFRRTTRKSNNYLEKKNYQYSCTHNFEEIYWSTRFWHSCSVLRIIVIDRFEHTETNNKMIFQVLEVKASCRIGEENLMSCLRKALQARYGEKPVALGGVFLVEKGKANLHIMVCFNSFILNVLSSQTVITFVSIGHYSNLAQLSPNFLNHSTLLVLNSNPLKEGA